MLPVGPQGFPCHPQLLSSCYLPGHPAASWSLEWESKRLSRVQLSTYFLTETWAWLLCAGLCEMGWLFLLCSFLSETQDMTVLSKQMFRMHGLAGVILPISCPNFGPNYLHLIKFPLRRGLVPCVCCCPLQPLAFAGSTCSLVLIIPLPLLVTAGQPHAGEVASFFPACHRTALGTQKEPHVLIPGC